MMTNATRASRATRLRAHEKGFELAANRLVKDSRFRHAPRLSRDSPLLVFDGSQTAGRNAHTRARSISYALYCDGVTRGRALRINVNPSAPQSSRSS